VNTAINLTLGGAAVPLVFMNPADIVPTLGLVDYMFSFDFDRDAPRIFRRNAGIYRESPMQFMSANDVDLSAFKLSGGKMIFYHGVSDPVFSINDTIDWFEKLSHRFDGRANRFIRLFAVPGNDSLARPYPSALSLPRPGQIPWRWQQGGCGQLRVCTATPRAGLL
jgi:feruloyl esterase